MYAQLIGRAELCLVLLPAPNQLLQPNQLLHHVAPWAL
jgi:hypothetical protein